MARKKGQQELLAGLDIGSTSVRFAVGSIAHGPEGDELHILAAAEAPSVGVHKGVVISIEDTVASIATALERTERLVGRPIEHVWVGISGTHIQAQESKGVIAVAKSNGEITGEDVMRAVDAARTVATPLNYEILHVIPQAYTVDGQKGLKNPVGMSGVRLEVDTQIIQGVSAHIKNITRAVYRTGLDINGVVLGILGASEAVLSPRQKELGVAVVNIGGSTTGVSIYEDGDLRYSAVIPVGSGHITNDLAIGLKIDIDVAEAVKIQYGTAYAKSVNKKEMVDFEQLGGSNDTHVSRSYIAKITQARVEEIFEKVDEVLSSVNRSGKLPAGVILTGGGSQLDGVIDLCKEQLRLHAQLGYPVGVTSVTDRAHDLSFATSIGLVKWGYASLKEGRDRGSAFAVVDKTATQIRDWFKSLLP